MGYVNWILVHVQYVMLVMKDADCTVHQKVGVMVGLTTVALCNGRSCSYEVIIH
jgi:hypothetical protein